MIGAGALGRARVEIDYVSSPPRAVFSCESDAPRDECFAAARCPRLPDASTQHLCFGLPLHGFAPRAPVGMLTSGRSDADAIVGRRPRGLRVDLLQWPRCASTPPSRWACSPSRRRPRAPRPRAFASPSPSSSWRGRRRPRWASSCRTASCSGWSAPARTCSIRPTPPRSSEGHPELQHCDASPCLKAIGQLLDVGYIVRVKVDVAGNSYKSVARLFSTEGAAPAALPIATESKSCDVCTVGEARAVMLRLADALRAHIEEQRAPAPRRPPRRPRRRRRTWSGRCCWRWPARSRSAPASRCSRRNGELHGDRLRRRTARAARSAAC